MPKKNKKSEPKSPDLNELISDRGLLDEEIAKFTAELDICSAKQKELESQISEIQARRDELQSKVQREADRLVDPATAEKQDLKDLITRKLKPFAEARVAGLKAWKNGHSIHFDKVDKTTQAVLLSLVSYTRISPGKEFQVKDGQVKLKNPEELFKKIGKKHQEMINDLIGKYNFVAASRIKSELLKNGDLSFATKFTINSGIVAKKENEQALDKYLSKLTKEVKSKIESYARK